ncbi:protein-L-isoaspartate O-methyltransferase [Methanococcus maripaludis]|uniref:Protein-L-isoaspartate O-methyltransferase n=2 Tax=Methanococcus maripaludis TaxID=39152 RepID=PIMT_METM7|nr:protein-L-isoaspartate O-methyltransferase [Methanococcus maripaludis]A6VI91.1 RecName: Full=Protein-L-isoaspartate O-methyltransferase; AltName: Full=L-isoaspartyl protein carboxyl methyltransferase; AltName: Full=Protein L-isoaspartyl methyltransferase; AltName: Full=Protein-beta-aspartate methyltransferase; Short=PIMT [Methanococcus maripaludis C7]MBA2862565.1 protein-L-isoaspartate(D-aspartate) O-methyltransferase [Methanococcus maripaludis]
MPLNEIVGVIGNLISNGYIKKQSVIDALMTVPRHKFIPKSMEEYAYIDSPLGIGYGQTISAIHMVGIMCEELDLDVGQNVLEVGTGSGYHAAVVSEIVGESGNVTTIERIPELFEKSKQVLLELGYENVEVVLGDGTKGYLENSPYDRIYVTASGPDVPKALFEQLNDGGIILAPVGSHFQTLMRYKKIHGKIFEEKLLEVAFVPLIGENGF